MHELDFAAVSYKLALLASNQLLVEFVFLFSSLFGFLYFQLEAPCG
jgi:hypothetical protein